MSDDIPSAEEFRHKIREGYQHSDTYIELRKQLQIAIDKGRKRFCVDKKNTEGLFWWELEELYEKGYVVYWSRSIYQYVVTV